MNDKGPQFQGVDVNGVYPAAVSDYTRLGNEVIYVSAIDTDSTAPNNLVSELLQSIAMFITCAAVLNNKTVA